MQQTTRFWDRVAPKYSRQPIADEDAYQRKLRKSREYFTPESKVLEFGCGTGSTALLHAAYVKDIQAIDISSKMIEIAQQKAAAQGIENVSFRQATIDDLNVPDQSLDVVLGLSILHLLENKEEAISNVFRMLKPGGVFISSTACLGDKMKFFKLIAPIGRFFRLLPILKVFTVKQLAQSLQAAGFEIEYRWQPEKAVSVFIVARRRQ